MRHVEAHCACGASWWAWWFDDTVDPDDETVECPQCGDMVTDLRDLGVVHDAGRDVAP